MQLRNAALAQAIALSSLLFVAHSGGCAAGTTEDSTPTGPVTTGVTTGPTGSTTHASSSASTSSAGGAGSTSSSSSTTSSTTAASTSATTSSTSASTSASTTASTTASSSASSGSGGCGSVYGHTITIDGTNDFSAVDTFATTSATYTGYVTWDANNLYIGMQGADVGSNDANKWVVAYISGASGTTTGQLYNTQQPTLPFSAKWHLRWKANNTFTNAQMWDGSSWVDAGWNFTGLVFRTGNYVEIAIPRTNIGSPNMVNVVLSMLNETNLAEGTYAGVPSTSFTDGVDPNFAHYFSFDLMGCDAPNMSTPL